ncbi:unnamed protein product [Caenorhabditis sp. 36 PRJEB53466]|nr:unnamed protein product [Caenorhabditis sp. 36 PRJEB53466]
MMSQSELVQMLNMANQRIELLEKENRLKDRHIRLLTIQSDVAEYNPQPKSLANEALKLENEQLKEKMERAEKRVAEMTRKLKKERRNSINIERENRHLRTKKIKNPDEWIDALLMDIREYREQMDEKEVALVKVRGELKMKMSQEKALDESLIKNGELTRTLNTRQTDQKSRKESRMLIVDGCLSVENVQKMMAERDEEAHELWSNWMKESEEI